MHATTSKSSVRRVAATSALALVALSGTAGTAIAAPGNPGNGKGNGSHNAAPQADKPQGKAKGYGKSKRKNGSKGSQGKPGGQSNQGKPAGQGNQGSGGKGSPPGNNGTVKIAPLGEMDGIPNNTPHVGCDFQIEWYGFDEGADVISKVSLAMQAPTSDVGLTVNGPSEVFVGEDPASGAGQDPDGVQAYSLSFDGEPHPKQGYHVKLTINTPRSNGSDVKHKVFWVEDCDESSPSSSSSTGEEDGDSLTGPGSEEDGTEDGADGGYEEGESGTESGSVEGGDSGESSDASGSSDSASMSGASGSSDSSSSSAASADSGVSARSGVSQDVTTSGASDTPGSVDAGLSGSDIARGSLIGLLVAAAGGALLWYARRTRAHG